MMKWTLIILVSVTASLFGGFQEGEQKSESDQQPVQALLTDSLVVQIDHPPEKVWAHLKRLYIDGDRYRQRGLDVTQIENDPAAFLGGLHAVSKPGTTEGAVDLKIRFSIIDDENHFTAMHLDGMLPKGIYVSHDVDPMGDGSRYQVIIHAFMEVGSDGNWPQTADGVREWMTARLEGHSQGLKQIVQQEVVEALDQ